MTAATAARTWHLQAACRHADPDLFFTMDGERGPAVRRRILAAKSVCQRCPVRPDCREFALATQQRHGIWGGLTEDQRAGIIYRRRHRLPEPDPKPRDHNRIGDEAEQRIVELYGQGVSKRAIALMVGVAERTVQRVLNGEPPAREAVAS